ncbi:H/ACA ribonucleoprotein complex subunit GAR1 [Halolamina rubra]|uniref:H/ACA ribonucleoprotein complex subunit GAR1 n=1 Tax=Halolamina rubra TaxID=1380430 RepID=UPI0006787E89|nr:Gar1/Naf1 family protein [Halolamina rubra]
MERVGTVSRTAQGLAIVRCPGSDHPRIGQTVVDESLDTVGRVVDVFGPVSQPYVAVSPADRDGLTALVGQKLYAR